MRILIVTHEYPPDIVGGIGRHSGILARSLAENGYAVDVVTGSFRGESNISVSQDTQIRVIRVKLNRAMPRIVGFSLAARSIIMHLAAKSDVTHFYSPIGGFFAKALRAIKRPVVVSVHGLTRMITSATLTAPMSDLLRYLTLEESSYLFVKGSFIDKLRRVEHAYSTAMVYPAIHLKDECERVFVPTGARHVIYPAIDADGGHVRKDSVGKHTFCYGGRLLFSKGATYAVEAFSRILNELPGAELHIYGRGPIEGRLVRRVKELHLSSNVKFIGFLPTEDYLRRLLDYNCFLFPSLYEVCPLALLEAQARGIPGVVFRFPWTKEFVTHGKDGYAAEPFDTEDLAKGISESLRLRDNYHSDMSRFTDEEMIRKMSDLFLSVT